MTCDRNALLTADLDAIEAALEDEGGHLATCAHCREGARSILAATAGLRSAMTFASEGGDPDINPGRAWSAGRNSRAPGPRQVRILRWGGLAAAALVGLLLVRLGSDRPLPGDPVPPGPAAVGGYEVSSAHNVVVLPTRNPDMTVLWLYE